MTRTWFEVVTSKGVTTFTFDTASAAREYVLRMKSVVPGLEVHEVTTTTVRSTVYKPRQVRAA